MKLWDLVKGSEVAAVKGDQSGVVNLIFSPDSKTLVTSSFESPPRLKLWNVPLREEVATLRSARGGDGQTKSISALAFSADGRLLALGHADGTIELFWGASGDE